MAKVENKISSEETKDAQDTGVRVYDNDLSGIIGLKCASIAAQINYWVKKYEKGEGISREDQARHFFDGHYWVYNTIDEWCNQLKWANPRTMRRGLKELEDYGILLTSHHNKKGFDKTKWYTLDYDKINEMISASNMDGCNVQNGHTERPKRTRAAAKSAKPIPESTTKTNTTETTTETTNKREPTGSTHIQRDLSCEHLKSSIVDHPEPVVEDFKESVSESEKHNVVQLRVYGIQTVDIEDNENDIQEKTADDFPPVNPDSVRIRIGDLSAGHDLKDVMICQLIANIYLEKYEKAMGKPHPANITDKTLNTMLDLISDWWPRWSCDAYGVGIEQWRIIIDKHFATKYAEGCDYSLNHFASERIVENRANEVSRTEEFAIA